MKKIFIFSNNVPDIVIDIKSIKPHIGEINDFCFQVLDFPRNPIEILENDVFMKRNLLNLQAITLKSCEINTIQLHAFRYVMFYEL